MSKANLKRNLTSWGECLKACFEGIKKVFCLFCFFFLPLLTLVCIVSFLFTALNFHTQNKPDSVYLYLIVNAFKACVLHYAREGGSSIKTAAFTNTKGFSITERWCHRTLVPCVLLQEFLIILSNSSYYLELFYKVVMNYISVLRIVIFVLLYLHHCSTKSMGFFSWLWKKKVSFCLLYMKEIFSCITRIIFCPFFGLYTLTMHTYIMDVCWFLPR